MSQKILTIMIPTTTDRRELFIRLCHELLNQISNYPNGEELIEIIHDEDNKEKSVGLKRQHLLEKANGVFVVGFDSDDFPAPTYIQDIMDAIMMNLWDDDFDHVGFLEDCTINGEKSLSIFSIRHLNWDENKDGYDHIRCANPKSVIRREKALMVGFPDMRFGEDRIFSEAVTPLLKKEIFINKPLYNYIHISSPHNERYGIKD